MLAPAVGVDSKLAAVEQGLEVLDIGCCQGIDVARVDELAPAPIPLRLGSDGR